MSEVKPKTTKKEYSVKETSQLLAHYFLAKKIVSENRYNALLSKYISNISKGQSVSAEIINCKANEILQEIGFQAQLLTSFGNKRYYICFSTMDDKLTKTKNWTPKESKLFWAMVKKMFKNLEEERDSFDPDDENCLKEMLFFYRTAPFDSEDLKTPGLTQHQIKALLQRWIQQNYFEVHRNERIMLGVRSLGEMGPLLMKKFNLLQCKSCKLICFIGYKCEKCSFVYHDKCCVLMKCNECKADMGKQQLLIEKRA